MEEIKKLVSDNYLFFEKLLREGTVKIQEVYSDGEELLPELKSSIIEGDLFNRKFIHHPLVIGDLGSLSNSYYNKQLIKKQQLLKEFKNNKEFENYLFLIEKPYRVLFFSNSFNLSWFFINCLL